MNKRVGNWSAAVNRDGTPKVCTLRRLHNNGSGEVPEIIWHQRLDDLLDLRYLVERAIGEMHE